MEASITIVYGVFTSREKYYGTALENSVLGWRRINTNTALYAFDVNERVCVCIITASTKPSTKRRVDPLFGRHVVLTKAGLRDFLAPYKGKAYAEWARFVAFAQTQGCLVDLQPPGFHMITTA